MADKQHLSVPKEMQSHFERNFIKKVVCELKFPTLFELNDTRPPLALAQALRKEYPIYEMLSDLNLTGASMDQSNVHLFKSRKSHWTVALRSSAITLETSKYDSFSEFHERLGFILKAAEKIIDSDFFTRMGLRYINSIDFGTDKVSEWINPILVSSYDSGAFGEVDEYANRVIGSLENGGYNFQHGLGLKHSSKLSEYVLDFDFFSEDVPFSDALNMVKVLHDHEFSMFSWALGSKAKEYLGKSNLKN